MALALPGRRRERADRVTLGIAGLAAVTAGTVIAGEVAKLVRLRAREAAADPEAAAPVGVIETAEQALASTQLGTQDAVVVAREGYAATPRSETVLFNLLAGSLGAFAVVRLSTHGMRGGWWPVGNVEVRGRHIHHFVPGILLAFGSGAVALLTADEEIESKLAIPFGVGVGLTLDEAALLLDLEDVYWTPEGVLSVQVSFGAAALLGGTILALRILRRGEREAQVLDQPEGPGPAPGLRASAMPPNP